MADLNTDVQTIVGVGEKRAAAMEKLRSEEHTSELQSQR